jgi:hypothetical protein
MSLAEALEAAAGALPAEADAIRPANGDAARLLATLSAEGAARVARWLMAERSVDAEELAEVWCEEAAGQAALLAVDEAANPKEPILFSQIWPIRKGALTFFLMLLNELPLKDLSNGCFW